jgi:hypothetical protein
MTGLQDSFFESSADETPATETTQSTETTPAPSATPEATQQTQVEQKGETTTPEDEDSKTGVVPKAALLDERKKRQEYERKLKELEERLTQNSNQPNAQNQNKQEEKAPDFYENPEERLAYERKQIREEFISERVRMSAALISRDRADYQEMVDAFREACAENPVLEHHMINSAVPALFAYEQGKKYLQTRDILKDPDGYRAKLEAEIREKLLKEFDDKSATKKPADERQQLTASLTGARTTGSDSKSATKEEDDSEDAFDGLFDPKSRRIKR